MKMQEEDIFTSLAAWKVFKTDGTTPFKNIHSEPDQNTY
jgi:hypothetical protein